MRKISFAFTLIAIFALILFSSVASASALEGLRLWATVIVPSLFPFIYLTNIILTHDSFKKWLARPSFAILYASLIGIFCGYPMGGKMLDDFTDAGYISSKTANLIFPAINNASPMFLMTYICSFALNNQFSRPVFIFLIYLPVILYLCIIGIYFVLIGILNKQISKKSYHIRKQNTLSRSLIMQGNSSGYHNHTASFQQSTLHSPLKNAIESIIKIGVTILWFSILTGILESIIPSECLFLRIGTCFLEITTGTNHLLSLSLLPQQKTAFIVALTVFGGGSAILQTKNILTTRKLSIIYYTIVKCLMALVIYLLLTMYSS